jgi:hypothetical protein
VVEVVGLHLLDALGAEFGDEAPGHHLEHAGHTALACGFQVRTVLVQKGGNQIIISTDRVVLSHQLAEPVEGGEVRGAGRCVVRSSGKEVLIASDGTAVGFLRLSVSHVGFRARLHLGILMRAEFVTHLERISRNS